MEKCRKNHPECPFRLSPKGCRVIMHHLFYPRQAYEDAGEIPAEFRELKENQVPMCEYEEKELHKQQPSGPPMPSFKVMDYVVQTQRQRRELAARPIHKP